MASDAPKVLLSYSHDSPEHARRVLALAERLRSDGVDAQLDQYVAGTPAKGWPRWMDDQLDSAQFILVICTETSLHRTKPWRTGVRTSRQENRRRVKLVDDQIPRLWTSVGLAPRAPDASR
jgi:hypothetical protein